MPLKRKRALGACFALGLMLALPAVAPAASTQAGLRVEGLNTTLDPGTTYLTGTETLPGATDAGCQPDNQNHRVPGATALGILGSAFETNRRLRPIGIAEDEFGLRVCRIGRFKETDVPSFTGWLYRVNHESPATGAALHRLREGDEVLWYFADFGNDINSGDELIVDAPVRARPGAIQVRVTAISFDGTQSPAADGTVVRGGDQPVMTTAGVATIMVDDEGPASVRALHKPDIPSAPVSICIAGRLADCPARRGERIIGTSHADDIIDSAGPDRIRAGGGRDRVTVAGGGRDVVDCGPGVDTATVGEEDVTRNCERQLLG